MNYGIHMSKSQFDTHIYETQISGVTVLQKVTRSMLFINKGLQALGVTPDL